MTTVPNPEAEVKQESADEAALAFVQAGFYVFPVNGKTPLTPHGFQDAFAEEEQVAFWWNRHPEAGVALPTGKINNLVVIDVDTHKGGDAHTLGDLPHTWQARTPHGGAHFYFQYPDGVENIKSGANVLGPAIDVRADGGYIVAPPSVLADGGQYTWLDGPDSAPLAELPEPLLKRLLEPRQKQKQRASSSEQGNTHTRLDAERWLREAVRRVKEQGQARNDTGFWLACQLRDARLPQADAEALLRRYAAEVADTGTHPYTEEEALNSLHSAYSQEAREPASGQEPARDELEFTDGGNAARLARQFSNRLKYVPEWGWLAYSEGVWRRGAAGQALEYAKASVKGMLREAVAADDYKRTIALTGHATRSFSDKRLKAMLALAQSEPGIAASMEQFDNQPWLLNVQNGTLDLRAGELREHRPSDYLTRRCPVAYEATATSELWARFLADITQSQEDLQKYLQCAVGYSLTGDTGEECFFLCHGTGRNGKSKFLEAVKYALGDYAASLRTETIMKKPGSSAAVPNDIAELVGVRYVFASEPEEGRLDVPLVKRLTGSDTVRARFLFKEHFEFRPQLKLWLAANALPEVEEVGPAIWERVKLVPFNAYFPPEKRDRQLGEKLKQEAPAILAWAVQGCRLWQELGCLPEPEAVKKAVRKYRRAQDKLADFFDEYCTLGEGLEADAAALNEAYQRWCVDSGASPREARRNKFYQQLEERGYVRVRRSKGHVYKGLALKRT